MDIKETIKNNENVIVDFYADWCAPCRMMTPILESLDDKIKIEKVNIEDYPELASEYKVVSIPTLFTYKDGVLKTTFTGAVTKEKLLESFI